MNFPTCNVSCVCCVTVYLILVIILRRYRTLLKQDIKVLKAIKLPNFVLFCGIKFYVTPTQPFRSLWGVYSNNLFFDLNTKIQISTNKHLIYVSYNSDREK